MPRKARPKGRKSKQPNKPPEVVKAPEAENVEAKPVDPPVEQPKKAEFQQLRCTGEPPEGFSGGRFARINYASVIAARPFMRR